MCETLGNTASNPTVTITCVDEILSPLSVSNLTDGTFFALDVDGTAGDVFVIDSEAQTATKNGNSVKSLRMPGSSFPRIYGVTELLVTDGTNGVGFNQFEVSVRYRDALL